MDHVAFAASAALAQVLTNLDNLAVLFALMLTLGPARALTGYLVAQLIVLGAALAAAIGAAQMLGEWSGYLGLVPLSLGLVGLWRQMRATPQATGQTLRGGASALMAALLFLGLSMDSFAVMTPLLADSTRSFRVAALLGALGAAAAMGTGALLLSRAADRAGGFASRFERLAPWAMILAGLYVLADSATDTI